MLTTDQIGKYWQVENKLNEFEEKMISEISYIDSRIFTIASGGDGCGGRSVLDNFQFTFQLIKLVGATTTFEYAFSQIQTNLSLTFVTVNWIECVQKK